MLKKDNNIFHKELNFVFYSVNQITVILICIWIAVPYLRNRTGVIFLLCIFILWLLTTDLKWLLQGWTRDLLFIGIFFITFLPYFLVGDLRYGLVGSQVILVSFPIFFVGIIINHYYMFYQKDYRALGRIALFFLLFFTIGSIQTYFGLLKYPMASRQLATGSLEFTQLYGQLGIGGFGYIYSATFLFIATLYPLFRKSTLFTATNKIIALLSSTVIFLMLLKASYAIALSLAIIGFILIFLVRSRLSFFFFMLTGALLILLIPANTVGEFFLTIADVFSNNKILNEKFKDVAFSILYSSLDGQAGNRLTLYASSLQTFLSNPIFGIYGPLGDSNEQLIGGHSGWFDLLGYYGLFTGIPLFLIFYFNLKKHMKFYNQTKYYGFIIIIYFLIGVFGTINPILYVYEIGFVLFCIIPAIPFIPYAFKKITKEKENEEGDFHNENFMAYQCPSSRSESANG